jgi:HEAT repeat protein
LHALITEKDEERVIRTLCVKLSDENEQVREAAADLIAARMEKSDESFTTLLKLIHDESGELRYAAFLALGGYHDKSDKRFIDSICERLNDESGLIRTRAAELLGESGTKSSVAVQALISRLSDDQPRVREAAANALGELGICNQKILKHLEHTAKKDQNEDVRHAADDALRRLNAAEMGSALLLGHTINITDAPFLERLFKNARLLKPSVLPPADE